MEVSRALCHGKTIIYLCKHCSELITNDISDLFEKNLITKCYDIRGFIDQCPKTKGFSFIYWSTND